MKDAPRGIMFCFWFFSKLWDFNEPNLDSGIFFSYMLKLLISEHRVLSKDGEVYSKVLDMLHYKSKVVYALLVLYFGNEIWNWKLGKTKI